nr:uncharacterized protein LOC109173736 [Ipomoea batatas]
MAGWNYPEISLEDLLKAIKGFIDMLILASGYQSSGRLAHWDSGNIKRALQWALFLEDVIGSLNSQDEYRDSLEELDVALCEMISMPYFPKGIEHLSSKTLSNARNLMLEHLTHTLPLRDLHLRALVTATVEMDFHMLPNADSDCLDKHFEELMHSESKKPAFNVSRHLMEDSVNTSMMTSPSRKANDAACSFSAITARELARRHMAVSSLSAAETCLEMLSRSVYHLNVSEPGKNLHDGVAHTGALISCDCAKDGKEHRECEGPLGDTKRGMKILNVLGMKWRGRRSGGGASAVTLLSLQKRAAPRNWCVGRHLEWRVRLWCRKLREAALGCQRKSMQQFSYDPQSYSQNFDDGHFKEHLSPLAPL